MLLASRYLHQRAHFHGPLMLMYHSVASDRRVPQWPWAVSQQAFIEQMDFLKAEGWETTTLEALTSGRAHMEPRTVAISFDDGYADNFSACEILAKRGMVASWFVVSHHLGGKSDWAGSEIPKLPMLTPGQVREMRSAGMEIGSHSASHVRLTDLEASDLARELATSKSLLEDLLGTFVGSLAYPYGCFDDRVLQAARDAGYERACTTQSGWALLDKDPLRVRRLTIYNTDNTSMLARKMAYAANDVSWPAIGRTHLHQAMRKLTKP